MNLVNKLLATGTLLLSGCAPADSNNSGPRTVEGTVKKEFGILSSPLNRLTGGLFSESYRGTLPLYGLVIESTQGEEYVLEINNSVEKPIGALAEAIERGDKVRITPSSSWMKIDDDGIGEVYSEDVKLIRRVEKQ